MTKLTIVAGVILVGNLFSAQAENLNRKYGPSWNCIYISASLPGLNRDCKQCEDQGKQFDQTSNDAGRCVTRDSLRESPEPEEDEMEKTYRRNGEAALEKQRRELERRRSMRIAPDSDVSGRR